MLVPRRIIVPALLLFLAGTATFIAANLLRPSAHEAASPFEDGWLSFRTGDIFLPSHDHEFWKQNTWEHPVLNLTHFTITAPEDGWVTGSAMRLVNAPNRAIHHVVVHNTNAEDPYCGKSPPPVIVGRGYEGFFAVPDGEWSVDRYPDGYGYPVKAGDVLWFHIALHNPDETSYPLALVQVNLGFVPAQSGRMLRTARYLRMFVDPECKTVFPLPPANNSTVLERSHAVEIPEDMRVLRVSGHMHENGTEFLVDAGAAFKHSFVPQLNPDGTFEKYDFSMPTDFFLRQGSQVQFGVKYQNFGAGYQEGGGTLYFLYAPTNET